MKSDRIPHTDLTVSRLAFGCAFLGIDWYDPNFISKTLPLIRIAYEQGITFFDLANTYGVGQAERAVGQWLAESPGCRDNVIIKSKCGDRLREGWFLDTSYDRILSSVDRSLDRLGVEHLDILLPHWADSLVEPEEVAKAFDRLERSGKVRYFSVSNDNATQIDLLKICVAQPLVANQIQLSLGHRHTTRASWKALSLMAAMGAAIVDHCHLRNPPRPGTFRSERRNSTPRQSALRRRP